MKHYTITVNGNTYEVTVEENVGAPVAPANTAIQKPAATAAPAPVKAPAPQATAPAGNIKVNSPMPGKILALKVSAGQSVKKGDVLMVLEAMKMENEIVAPQDGSIAGINVSAGQSVEAGDLLATLN